MQLNLPQIIAHRGASHAAPENTLAAVELAYHENARWVEVDVKLAADGVPILMHDATLDRTTNLSGPVNAKAAAMLATADAGSWFDPRFADAGVPALDALLDFAIEHEMGLNLEIKPNPNEARRTAEQIMALLARRAAHQVPEILFSSFNTAALAALDEAGDPRPRGVLFHALPPSWQDQAQLVRAWSVHAEGKTLSQSKVAAVKDAGYPLVVFTINDAAMAKRLLAWGVDALITDRPKALAEELAQ